MIMARKNPHAVGVGRMGGGRRAEGLSGGEGPQIVREGGRARAEKVSAEQLSETGRKGGKAGGKARARALTKERRQEIARKAAAARWGKEQGRRRLGGARMAFCPPCSSSGRPGSISSPNSSAAGGCGGLRFYFPFAFWLVVAASGLAVCSMRTPLWTRWWSPGPRIGNGSSKTRSADS